MPNYYVVLVSTLCVALSACSGPIRPFTSDGCSAFPDGTPTQKELWLDCCTAHDYAYWQGGSYAQRLDADLELQTCVAEVGKPEIAALMIAGVRVGGSPLWPTSFRWGYGWPYFKWYGELSENEISQIEKHRSEGIDASK